MSAARKYLYDLSLPEKKTIQKEEKFKLIKNTNKNNISKTNKATLVMATLIIFAMFMVITYRYNVISEKNLQIQQLKEDLVVAKSELATSEIALEQVMDVNYVESYAKQQLGMQKPEKSQLIYVNMESTDTVNKVSASNMFNELAQKVKSMIDKVF